MTLVSQDLVDFGGLSIRTGPGVLAPRPWTEAQSRWAAELSPVLPPGPILELCAGAGQIGLLAAALTRRALVQVEVDPVAARYARQNADSLRDVSVEVRCSAMSVALAPSERFPLVIADPPYIREADIDRYPEDPVLAIDGGESGLERIEEALLVAGAHLHGKGVCLLQVAGAGQVTEIEAAGLIAQAGLKVRTLRVVDARRAVCLLEPRR